VSDKLPLDYGWREAIKIYGKRLLVLIAWTLGLAAVGATGYYSTLVIMQVFSR